MLFQIITQFPERYEAYIETGLPAKAYKKGLFQLRTFQIRDFTDKERGGRIDETPYGGGPGMLMQIAPINRAIQAMPKTLPVILFTPRGKRLTQKQVHSFSKDKEGFTLLCGYYEGVDERVGKYLVDYQISLGDFVLGSGDLPALCFIEAVTRLLPCYTGSPLSLVEESNQDGLLEYPQYTRPADYNGWEVPKVLLSGNHKEIARWRLEKSKELTQQRRKEERNKENE